MSHPATPAPPLEVTDPHDHLVRVLADMAEYRQRFPTEPLVAHRLYRLLYDELELLDEMGEDTGRDSPLLQPVPVPVGAVVRHPTPMYPLAMSTTAGFYQWAKRLKPRTRLYALPVPFGPTVEIVYRNGSYAEAIIHGNGLEGLDVTERLRCSPSVPQTIPVPRPLTSVFATVSLSDDALTRVNRALRRRGQLTPLTPRKAALALLSGKVGGAFELRHLVALPYDCPALRLTHKSMTAALGTMAGWGFAGQMVVAGTAANLKEVSELYQRCKRHIDLDLVFDFAAQAIGVFLDDPEQWLVDAERRAPAFARLWKIEGETAETFITNLSHRVGRHGTVLPVATITPVTVDEQRVSEVTLPSVGYAKQWQLGAGSAVRIRLVAAHLPEVIVNDTIPPAEPYQPPQVCPSCGHALITAAPHLRCGNETCPAVCLARLVHATSRNCLQLPHLTEPVLNGLMGLGMISDLASLFRLTPPILAPLLGAVPATATCAALGQISASLITNDAMSEHLLVRLLHALSLHGLTPRTIPLLVEQMTEQEVFDEHNRPYPMVGFLPHVLTTLQTLEAVLPATLAREVWRHAFIRRDELIRLADCFHPTDLESLPS